jgi:PPK2 family polyphosphate:nucleotide phosphotransferase
VPLLFLFAVEALKVSSPTVKTHSSYLIPPHTKVRLKHHAPDDTGSYKDQDASKPDLEKYLKRLDKSQEVLYAGAERGLLIVLQGMDTAGKDGTIRHIFTGVNPQGCGVTAFKVPTPLEAHHDFLWRCHAAAPQRGMIGIFNRSHYEDVLSSRVHGTMKEKTAREHMEQINDFESMLVDNGIAVLKFFLHISPEEQKRRLQSRIDDASKHWKLSASDFTERKFWPDYQRCYEDIFSHTSHKHAPWFVIPSDNKWYRNVAISSILADAMEGMKLQYPAVTVDVSTLKL